MLYTLDACRARAASRPADERLEGVAAALQEGLDAAVAPVTHPAPDAEGTRFVAQCKAKADALHAATYANLKSLHACRPC